MSLTGPADSSRGSHLKFVTVLCLDAAYSKNAYAHDLELDVEFGLVAWVIAPEQIVEFVFGPPVRRVVGRAALEVSLVEIKVTQLARSAQLGELRVELLEACLEAWLVPAANDELSRFTAALEHLADGSFLHELRQYADRVHAHAADAQCAVAPEVMSLTIHRVEDDFVEFDGVALLELDLAALQLAQVVVQTQRRVDHGLVKFHADQIIKIVGDFGK